MSHTKSHIGKDKQRQNQQGGQQDDVSRRKKPGVEQEELTRQQQQDSTSPRKPGKDPDVLEDESSANRNSRKPTVEDDDR